MFDFTNSIKNGIAAAETANENIKEINSVFSELATQIEAFSTGSLTARLETSPDIWGSHALSAGILGAAMATGLRGGNNIKDKTTLVLASKKSPSDKVALATVDISKLGYPVKFIHADQVSNASDKESLVVLLSSILEHPDSGKAISRMMSHLADDESGDQHGPGTSKS